MTKIILLTAITLSLLSTSPATPPASGCVYAVRWIADMSAAEQKKPAAARASGTAEMQFNWTKPYGTFIIHTKNLKNVESIELRAMMHPGDFAGPFIVKAYDASEGPYRGGLTKHFTQTDILPQNQPVKSGYPDFAEAILHHKVAVIVKTKAKPAGEIAGVIMPHRVLTYTGSGGVHNSKLHHQPRFGGI